MWVWICCREGKSGDDRTIWCWMNCWCDTLKESTIWSYWDLYTHVPPDLCQLKNVYDALEEPHAGSAAALSVAPGSGDRSGAASAPLIAVLGAEVALRIGRRNQCSRSRAAPVGVRVIVGEPSEAEHLHHHRRNDDKNECRSEPPVLPSEIVFGSQPQVWSPVREKDQEGAEGPAAVQERILLPDGTPLWRALLQPGETRRRNVILQRSGCTVWFRGHVCCRKESRWKGETGVWVGGGRVSVWEGEKRAGTGTKTLLVIPAWTSSSCFST